MLRSQRCGKPSASSAVSVLSLPGMVLLDKTMEEPPNLTPV